MQSWKQVEMWCPVQAAWGVTLVRKLRQSLRHRESWPRQLHAHDTYVVEVEVLGGQGWAGTYKLEAYGKPILGDRHDKVKASSYFFLFFNFSFILSFYFIFYNFLQDTLVISFLFHPHPLRFLPYPHTLSILYYCCPNIFIYTYRNTTSWAH